ncbi:putative F-box protein At5g55150 [Silene latifolia]|uniref:putative F-box protein At5g55150 n=1 Tax=Silene latifolia TaxID=37657 RepID=UPI003D77AB22
MRSYSWPLHSESYLFMYDKFVLSENPSTNTDYVLAMIFPANHDLAFWKSGDKEWTLLNTHNSIFFDITFYKGEFYAVEQHGKIIAMGNSSPPARPRLVADLEFQCTSPDLSYLVESNGVLLLVLRELEDYDAYTLELGCFTVCEIDVDTGEATEKKSLGNRALFLGHNSSFSVEASPPICKPNCIYYTDNYEINYLTSDKIKRCDMVV